LLLHGLVKKITGCFARGGYFPVVALLKGDAGLPSPWSWNTS